MREQPRDEESNALFLRCSVLDTATTTLHDIELDLTPESTVASLLQALPVDVGQRRAFVGPEPLRPQDTVADSALTAGCVISVGDPHPDHRRIPPDAVGVLRAIAGPDTGRWTWVAAGRPVTVGRGEQAGLALLDQTVSRQHAQVVVAVGADAAASLRDIGSTSGTRVAGAEIDREVVLPDGGTFQVGQAVVQWRPLQRVDGERQRSPDGQILFTRRFHQAPAPPPAVVDLPAALSESTRGAVTLAISMGAPLLVGVVMYAVTRNVAFLLMTLLSPLTLAAQQAAGRRARREKAAQFADDKARAVAAIAKEVTKEEQVRHVNDPDELSLRLNALGALPGLWTKRYHGDDALTVRVGHTDMPAALQLQGERWHGLELPTLRAVPVTVDLAPTQVLGVVGDPALVEGLTRWLVLQLATRRSPEDLRLVVLSKGAGEHLQWMRWLPHLDAGDDADAPCLVAVTPAAREARIAELARTVEARERGKKDIAGKVTFGTDIVVVLDGARSLRHLPGMRTVLTRGPDVGVYAICADDTDINECRGTVTLEPGGRLEVVRNERERPETATAELTRFEDAEQTARLLAPLRDRAHASGSDGAIPYPVRFLDLVKIHEPRSDDVLRIWQENPGPTMRVPLGADARDVVHVDLVEHGPHTMMGGAPGAGKSFLLQALVASLLLHNRQDELNLLLMDFKGGATFLPFVTENEEGEGPDPSTIWPPRCRQVVGLIRNVADDPTQRFDEAAAHRVLSSLEAEVRQRQSRLARYGGEIDRYLRERPAGTPALPRLLLICDEFGEAHDTVPGFMPRLVSIGRTGRSLGIHMLLATQTLTGLLPDQLRKSIDLRISLRQAEVSESLEILEVPDAASIPGRLKGRGLFLTRKEVPPLARPFQAGYLGAPPPRRVAPPARARLVAWSTLGDARPQEQVAEPEQRNDQDLLLTAIEHACTQVAEDPTAPVPDPVRPLLPPLPAEVALTELEAISTQSTPPDALPFGLADLPDEQAQPQQYLSLTGDVRLMITGGSQSGRTTAVRTLLHAAAGRIAPDDLHLYVLEHRPSGLSGYEALAHCGGVFGPGEPERARHFLTWLEGEVTRRVAQQFTSTERPPRLLVLVDGWERLYDPADMMAMETSLARILREVVKRGPNVGVHVVVTCERATFTSKLGDLFDTRLVLKFPSADVVKAVLPSGAPLPPLIPGRGVVAGEARHVQVAVPGESLDQLMNRLPWAPPALARAPRQFPALPRHVDGADLPRPDGVSNGWVPLGVGGSDVEPVGVDLFAGPQVLLVSGPAGSGRSTAAAAAALALAGQGVACVVLCTPRSPLAALLAGRPNIAVLVGPTIADSSVRSAAEALGTAQTVVIVDDCEQVTVESGGSVFDDTKTLVEEAITPDKLGRLGLVLCGNAMPLIERSRSLSAVTRYAVEEGARVLLSPTQREVARAHGFLLEADQFCAGPPGRGHLVAGADRRLVQLGALA